MDKFKTCLSLLGLDEKASIADVKKRYFELAKLFHPDVNKNTQEEFIAVTKAYNYLMDVLKGDEAADLNDDIYESKKEINYKQVAKKFFAAGIKYFKEGDINNAIYMFEEALRKDNNTRYKQWLVKSYMHKERRLYDAKQLCFELIREEPWNPENYVLLGDIYCKKKLYKAAYEYYNKAIELGYPKDKLKDKLVKDKKGMFGRFFKK
ncbi:J domain-containing protein [Deferribacter abyssi]|uniref:J domain-containing protein n=1 Tax=Deferribacter abyssi TaxID=213806 RepID=UPI003C1C20AC